MLIAQLTVMCDYDEVIIFGLIAQVVSCVIYDLFDVRESSSSCYLNGFHNLCLSPVVECSISVINHTSILEAYWD